MKLQEYDDEDLIEEIKHRGFKIEVNMSGMNIDFDDKTNILKTTFKDFKVLIGGVAFDVTK